jgi:hypothetical protein
VDPQHIRVHLAALRGCDLLPARTAGVSSRGGSVLLYHDDDGAGANPLLSVSRLLIAPRDGYEETA